MIGELIEKEIIDTHDFLIAENQLSTEKLQELLKTERLGNEFKSKVTIAFNTRHGIKKVTTTVWSVTEKHIQLKNNVHIPIHAIVDIEL